MSKKLAKNALEILLMLEKEDKDKLDVLHAVKSETSSEYTVQAVEELIVELHPNKEDSQVHANRENLDIKSLREIASNSSRVVHWYLHSYDSTSGGASTVRGPWNRWITISEGNDPEFKHIATPQADAKFVYAAMNNFEPLLDRVEQLEAELTKLRGQNA